jgi:hypothetical protein
MLSPDLERLVESLEPVKPVGPALGALRLGLALVIGAVLVLLVLGPRSNFFAFFSHPLIIGRTALLLLLGALASRELLAMARPRVGRRGLGWKWAAFSAVALVVAAFGYAFTRPEPFPLATSFGHWAWCLAEIAALSIGMAAVMVAWLRKGAPAAPLAAGWLTGVGAGSLGTLLYSLHCPHNSIAAIALWYSLAILVCAIAGRLIVPRLVRW